MVLKYYAQSADRVHWNRVWAGQRLDHLLTVAQRDPLSKILEAHLPRSGRIIEGGCGLGQYVLHFRRLGYEVIGGDFSLAALTVHRATSPGSPLVALDLARLPFADCSFQAQISLGVVEHVENGPQALLKELHRTLCPGGTLLVSVPWVNGMRSGLAPLIRRRQARRHAGGAAFYQYAFTRREFRTVLTEAGFSVARFYPYSPGRGVRSLLSRIGRSDSSAAAPAPNGAAHPPDVGLHRLLRRLLYTPPLLWTFAHMILAVAHKPGTHD